jgi:hypothetical protein
VGQLLELFAESDQVGDMHVDMLLEESIDDGIYSLKSVSTVWDEQKHARDGDGQFAPKDGIAGKPVKELSQQMKDRVAEKSSLVGIAELERHIDRMKSTGDWPEEYVAEYQKHLSKKMVLRSPEFKAWFGDWENDPESASKVVDEFGEPQEQGEIEDPEVMYHGTKKGGFTQFDASKNADHDQLLYGPGFYFTADKEVAETYAGDDTLNRSHVEAAWEHLKDTHSQEEVFGGYYANMDLTDERHRRNTFQNANRENVVEMAEAAGWVREKPEVKMVYLNIRKPFDVDAAVKGLPVSEWSEDFKKKMAIEVRKESEFAISDAIELRKQTETARQETPEDFAPGGEWEGHDVDYMRQADMQERRGKETLRLLESGNRDKAIQYKKHPDYFRLYKDLGSKTAANEWLQSQGYDGITHVGGNIMGGGHQHRVFIAFKPNQVKAVDNEGAFSADESNMFKGTFDDLFVKAGLFGDDFEPREPRKGRKPKFEGRVKERQVTLFDAGHDDLEGQDLLFNTDPGAGNSDRTMESKVAAGAFDEYEHPRNEKGQFTSKPSIVGTAVTVPASHTYGEFEAMIVDRGDGKVDIARITEDGELSKVASIRRENVDRWHDELSGLMRETPDSGNAHLDKVLRGEGEFLGRGQGGMVFGSGDKVVKAATVTPYHWNQGVRSPEQGNADLRNEADVVDEMIAAGVENLLPLTTIEHEGRVFAVREKVQLDGFTQEHIDQAGESLSAMNAAGYAMRDRVQIGVGDDGNVKFYDVGEAGKVSGHWAKDTMNDDHSGLSRIAEEHGLSYVTPKDKEAYPQWESMLTEVRTAIDSGDHEDLGILQWQLKNRFKRLKLIDATMAEFIEDEHIAGMKEIDSLLGDENISKSLSLKSRGMSSAVGESGGFLVNNTKAKQCPDCKASMKVHSRSGNWVCECGHEEKPDGPFSEWFNRLFAQASKSVKISCSVYGIDTLRDGRNSERLMLWSQQ